MDVFGTPAMVALMEAAACDALRSGLAAGETSVGTHVDVKHLAATPLGMQVGPSGKCGSAQATQAARRISGVLAACPRRVRVHSGAEREEAGPASTTTVD